MSKCFQVYTHNDLDGAVSLLTFLWAHPKDHVNWKSINNLQIDNLKINLSETNNPCETYILDLALRESFLPELDEEYITFIDHHDSSLPFLSKFKKAKIIHQISSSNALLMAQKYSAANGYPARTTPQKMLIALADDFDCYRLNLPESYDLNILFWSEYRNKFSQFIKDYLNGFKSFSPEQKKMISFIKKTAEEEADQLPLFSGKINISNKQKNILAATTEKFSTQIMDVLINRYKPDLFFFINTKSEKVCIRQYSKEDPINVGSFAEKICDGGGHNHAGGGVITPLFMEITKNLLPLRNK